MVKACAFVVIYSLILMTLFSVFSYLMTTVDPHRNPIIQNKTVSSITPSTVQFLEATFPKMIIFTSDIPDYLKLSKIKKSGFFHGGAHPHEPNDYPVPRGGYRRKDDNIDVTSVRFFYIEIYLSRELYFFEL